MCNAPPEISVMLQFLLHRELNDIFPKPISFDIMPVKAPRPSRERCKIVELLST